MRINTLIIIILFIISCDRPNTTYQEQPYQDDLVHEPIHFELDTVVIDSLVK